MPYNCNETPCYSCANPIYTADELVYQLKTTKAKVLISHSGSLQTALSASRLSGIAADHIIVMDSLQTKEPIPYPSVSDLVAEGLSSSITYTERRLEAGEGKTKLAFLSFSSGTTGKPKVFRTILYLIFIYHSQRI